MERLRVSVIAGLFCLLYLAFLLVTSEFWGSNSGSGFKEEEMNIRASPKPKHSSVTSFPQSSTAPSPAGTVVGNERQTVFADPCLAFKGILHRDGEACCVESCGVNCGAVTCHRGLGGIEGCCISAILNAKRTCSTNQPAPCTLEHPVILASASPLPLPPHGAVTTGTGGQSRFSTVNCHQSEFTHFCHLKHVTYSDGVFHAHNELLDDTSTRTLSLPPQLSPRYNKPKVSNRPIFPPTKGSAWARTPYDENRCSHVFDVPTYVFEPYFSSNFFHLINDNLLPLLATIDRVEGSDNLASSSARQIVFLDSDNQYREKGPHMNLMRWQSLFESLYDRKWKFWKDVDALAASQGNIVCFRSISFNLVDVHLLRPWASLAADEQAMRLRVMQHFRSAAYRAYNIPFPSSHLCERLPDNSLPQHLRPQAGIVVRKRGSARHCTNDNEIQELLEKRGYQARLLSLENMSVKEQLEQWSQTCLFVAAHGAGVMNALLLPEHSRVIQVFPFGLRQDYAKSTVDCGSQCYRGEYIKDMSEVLLGTGIYGEVMVSDINETTIYNRKPNHDKWLADPWSIWTKYPKLGVDILIKGRTDYKTNITALNEVVAKIVGEEGGGIDFGPLSPSKISKQFGEQGKSNKAWQKQPNNAKFRGRGLKKKVAAS